MKDTVPTPGPTPAAVTNAPVRQAALVAGAGILVLAVLSGFANFVGVEGLVTEGDAGRTAHDILAAEGLFRFAIAALVLAAALDVVVAWGLFEFFKPVHLGVSRLAAWLRMTYAAVFAVAVSQLAGALHLLGDDSYLRTFGADQLNAAALLKIGDFHDIWDVALVLFGVHLVLVGYLAWVSGQVPKIIGVLLVVAGLGYLVDSFGAFLVADYSISVAGFTVVGEALLMVWLLVKGRRRP